VDWQTGREVEGNALLVEKSSLNPSRIFQRVRQFSSGTMIGQSLGYVVAGLSIFFLALTSLAIISAAVLTRSITRAVHHLYRGTRRVEAGDLEHEIPPLGRDQLAELAISFNQMMRSVRELLRVSAEKQRLDQEMRIAAEVQARLFPRGTPPSQSLEIAPGICIPARSVSGDYYDFLEVAPGIIGFVVADVCGKGMSAALLMSNLQANLRGQVQAYRDLYEARGGATVTALEVLPATPGEPAQAQSALLQRHGQSPEAWTVRHSVSQVVARVNRQIEGSINDSRYVTFFYAEYEEATALLRYTNAGHNPPLLVRHDRRVERLECGGPVLGIFREAEYEEGTVKLTHGDLLVAFTDGLIEAHNAAGEEFGETRLCEVLKANLTLPPSKIEQALLQAVRDWTNGAEQEDDLTLVLLKCR